VIDEVVGDLEPEIGDGAAALGDIADRSCEADLLEGDRMEAEEGGGVSLGIVIVQRKTVIIGDLLPQAFAAGGEIGFLTHTARYELWPWSKASSLPRPPHRQALAQAEATPSRLNKRKQIRLAVPPGGGALRHRAAILF
jgi:hypothetical protein